MNSRFDIVTIKDRLWMNSRLGFAEKNDGYETYVRTSPRTIHIVSRFFFTYASNRMPRFWLTSAIRFRLLLSKKKESRGTKNQGGHRIEGDNW